MDAHIEQYLRDEIFSLTLAGTVGRAKVYKVGLPEKVRKPLRVTLRAQIERIAQQYASDVAEETHIQNIVGLSAKLSTTHANLLRGGRFRIGTAQKALNLYLKYLWCLGKIPAPPHCPFDFQIIAKLSGYTGPSWTVLDTDKDYRALVTAAKAQAHSVPLAHWELQAYNNVKPVTSAASRPGQKKKTTHKSTSPRWQH